MAIDEIVGTLCQGINRGDVEIPAMPDVALEVLFLAQDEKTELSEIVAVIARDPAIAAHVVRQANSAAFRAFPRVTTIEEAVSRVGLQRTQNTVMTMCLQQVFSCDGMSPHACDRISNIWHHSRECAVVSYLLARQHAHLDPNTALLAGLVHDIGKIPLLRVMGREFDWDSDPEAVDEALNRSHADVGEAVLRRWNFPSSVIRAVKEHGDLDRTPDPAEPVNYVDVIQAANVECFLSTPSGKKWADRRKIPAVQRVDSGFDSTGLRWDLDKRGIRMVNSIFGDAET
ncbi:metal dependent phosphohydrolase (plasmid) [Thioalkalivibrio sp. K90mix]|uniref:HDOD domain-containing protein n=1 Tax=Thioalkalivibrio sp. (strain K90mix) TaxID=396595 RepID=UPI000195A687|nr:HDOD domain-containing protein [Thioalkalivibrio sp. K90mix]ADC73257.1 metal dependent phosphohydrolase [Thioalkalivibrio sp. K90mix]